MCASWRSNAADDATAPRRNEQSTAMKRNLRWIPPYIVATVLTVAVAAALIRMASSGAHEYDRAAPPGAAAKGGSAGDSQWTRDLGRVGADRMRARRPL
jgi:flagellar basal body-associated protein FliL